MTEPLLQNKIIQGFAYQYSQKFHDICLPLFENTPVTFFSIGRYYHNGGYTGFMSDPKWTDLYREQHYFSALPDVINYCLSYMPTNFDLWTLSNVYSQNQSTERLYQDCAAFDYTNGITLSEKFGDYTEFYWFSSDKKEGIDRFFLEKQDLLKLFILYAKDKIMQDKELNLEINKAYFLPGLSDSTTPVSLLQDDEWLKQLEISRYYIGENKDVHLTCKELECLLLLLQDRMTKEMAQTLQISKRTVETHISHIKVKARCTNIREIRRRFKDNQFVRALGGVLRL